MTLSRYTLYEKKRVIQLAKEGKTTTQMAKALDRSRHSIRAFCDTHGISLTPEQKDISKYCSKCADERETGRKMLDRAVRLSVMQIAKNCLQDKLIIGKDTNMLMVNGHYVPATVNQIMRAANAILARSGNKNQITTNPEWRVEI